MMRPIMSAEDSNPLSQDFYARDALEVARDLLGCELRRGAVRLRITETEAYRHPNDSANHCRMGRTRRNAPMWGPPGHAYVYLCYGIHHMLNLVTNRDGEGAAVLIRACEPVAGIPIIRRRRKMAVDGPALLAGPGRVAQALGLDRRHSGHPLYVDGGLTVHPGREVKEVLAGPRVGIQYAEPEHIEAPWRLADGSSDWVSRPNDLRRLPDPRRP